VLLQRVLVDKLARNTTARVLRDAVGRTPRPPDPRARTLDHALLDPRPPRQRIDDGWGHRSM
jgi:hypothetical protein